MRGFCWQMVIICDIPSSVCFNPPPFLATHTHTLTPSHTHTQYRPVAIALYDYEALGEEGTLNFDEGEVVEV